LFENKTGGRIPWGGMPFQMRDFYKRFGRGISFLWKMWLMVWFVLMGIFRA